MENISSSKQLVLFCFGDHLVRVIPDEYGEPWFVAKDVALALDYKWNGKDCIAHVPEEWRVVRSVLTTFGEKDTWLLSEPGLYFFLGRSDKPRALSFQKWIAGEVLPSIRKTGRYEMPRAKRIAICPIPENLPPDVLRVRPAMRQKLWRDALRAAYLDSSTVEGAWEYFVGLCRVVGAAPAALENMEPDDMAREFFAERCEYKKGSRVSAAALYEALRVWVKANNLYLPSKKTFGRAMSLLAGRVRSNGSWYFDICLK